MTKEGQSRSGHIILATILSFFIPGVGQLYLRRILKGFILIISFALSIIIIWFALSNQEFKMFDWYGKKVMFGPAMKSVNLGGQIFRVIDIMKVTGTIQLLITWVFGLVDVLRDNKD